MSVCRQAETMFSPRAWGWTDVVRVECADGEAFPTRVGMDRCSHELGRGPVRFPHARGDGPAGVPPVRGDIPFSHARGDGPVGSPVSSTAHRFSPRAWGWTGSLLPTISAIAVFPTRVGMDRIASLCLSGRLAFSHARGDGPDGVRHYRHAKRVFPTRVGMDRTLNTSSRNQSGFPHARGDGPGIKPHRRHRNRFSPRAWGWTADTALLRPICAVFPTRVGMDRIGHLAYQVHSMFSHARGDGPHHITGKPTALMFSPRAWGWTAPQNSPSLA